ncbi:MAG: ABC transporter ATP-binding protein [Candidatus Omnitrophota bacterium]
MQRILEVKNLKTCFYQDDQKFVVVDDVSFSLDENTVLGIVGESGCGKTITALSLTKLLPDRDCKIIAGTVNFKGENILGFESKELRKIRGKQISYIFQEPSTSLNPVLSINEQMKEVVLLHRPDIEQKSIDQFLVNQLENVGIKPARDKLNAYAHQLSGGQKQRVMIAMALISQPQLLIADEPTTALDVTVQAQILELITELKAKLKLSIIFISHDLDVIAQVSDYIAVMYTGEIVELAPTLELIKNPNHPYTQGLLACLAKAQVNQQKKLKVIDGQVPQPGTLLCGCSFFPRCAQAMARCQKEKPELRKFGVNQEVRCWLYSS